MKPKACFTDHRAMVSCADMPVGPVMTHDFLQLQSSRDVAGCLRLMEDIWTLPKVPLVQNALVGDAATLLNQHLDLLSDERHVRAMPLSCLVAFPCSGCAQCCEVHTEALAVQFHSPF